MNRQNDLAGAEIEFGTGLGGELSPLHQVCPKEGQTIRIALLDGFCKPKASFYHWYRNGFYRCNTKEEGPQAPCCKVQRSWTCVSLALVYLNADADGRLAQGADIRFRIGYVSLARTSYQEVSEWMKEAPGCDLLYTKKGGSNSIRGGSRTPLWKLSPQAGQVETEAKRWADGKKLAEKLGKKLTDEEWVRLLKTGSIHEIEELD